MNEHASSPGIPSSPSFPRRSKAARLGLLLGMCLGLGAGTPGLLTAGVPSPAASRPPLVTGESGFVYARDYPFLDYQSAPTHNEIARLAQRIARGEVKLEYREPRGYLDSLLKALSIDPASQSLVFSKTSLQMDLITAQTPRSLFFNDDTYIGWMPNSPMLEIATMDSDLGAVFYTLPQPQQGPPRFQHETSRCLTCHDTYSMGGGGVPRFMFLSAYSRERGQIITNSIAESTDDGTPIEDRWGGWYVTGQVGNLRHLGDLFPSPAGRLAASALKPQSLDHLSGLLDTQPYPTDTSDVVALLVFGHEVFAHNLLVRASYKSRMLMEAQQRGAGRTGLSWEQLTPTSQQRMKGLLEPVVRGLLFSGAAGLPTPVAGRGDFQRGFEARGPRDPQGRSLRDLDLNTRLFKHPLSFLIYSQAFDEEPAVVKTFIYRRLVDILSGTDQSAPYAHLSPAERSTLLQILQSTKPDFARFMAQGAAIPPITRAP